MNPKRKAELQRKLSIMPVPRPPVDLVDRIKADIPANLAEVTGREERTSAAFTLRIAASILIVVASTAFVALYLLPGRKTAMLPSSAPRTTAVRALEAPKAVPETELTVSIAEAPRQQQPATPAGIVAESRQKDSPRRAQRIETAAAAGDIQQHSEGTIVSANARADAAEMKSEATAGAVAQSGVPPAPPATEQAPVSIADNVAVTAAAPAAPQNALGAVAADVGRAAAKKASPGTALANAQRTGTPPREMFGISMDPAALQRVQKTIESGQRPAAASVDVEGIVSYLAAPAAPAKGVSFDVEASREPDVVNSRSAMIRFTIDTARAPARPGLVGSNARLEIGFDDVAVASYRILGGARALTLREPQLFDNASVTGVIEVVLNTGLQPLQKVATLKLRYYDEHGRSQTIQKIVYANDLGRSWEMASFRHRLATLGAIWGESIKEGSTPADVVRTARELATEAPRDTRARDLADVANASSLLDGSGSSGSELR